MPLTSSMYIPGKIADVENVLVDVGTGYFVEKSVEAADDFYDRKVKLLQANLDRVQKALAQKQKQHDQIMDVRLSWVGGGGLAACVG